MGAIAKMTQSADDFFTLPLVGYTLAKSLSAGVAESFAVPAGARYVLFSANYDFYAKGDGTATVPGDNTDGAASQLNPAGRYIEGVESISVISPAACVVTATFFT